MIVAGDRLYKSSGFTPSVSNRQSPHNLEVAGSNPAPATSKSRRRPIREDEGETRWSYFETPAKAQKDRHSAGLFFCAEYRCWLVPILFGTEFAPWFRR